TTGFVSSIDTGGLARDMANAATYLFPVGSSVGVLRYRPVEIAPTVGTAHTYKVRMANVDATTEGYDRTINDSTFCVINPDYYHLIYQTAGASAADVAIYYNDVLDNAYQAMAHWQNLPRWEDISPVTIALNVNPPLSSMTKLAWNDYSLPAFGLGTTSPLVSLSSNDTSICVGDTLTFTASSGFANYEFFNNSISVQNGALNTYQVTGLTTGDTIRVTASDLSCTAFSNELIVTVNALPVLETTAMVISPEACGALDGSIVGIIATGTAPFTYQWLDGTSTIVGGDSANVMNLPAGGYNLTVTDINGCSASSGTHTVIGAPTPVLDTTSMVITFSTCGASDGAIVGITASGGTGPLTYNWDNSVPVSVGSTANLNSVPADGYVLTVTDSLGCTDATGPHTITDLGGPVLDSSAMVITPSTCGNSNGSIIGMTGTGIAPFTFEWVDGSSTLVGTAPNVIGIPGDSYTLTVTDSNGCTASTGPHVVGDEPGPVLDTTGFVITQSTCGNNDGSVTGITVTGGTGTLTFDWVNTVPITVGSILALNTIPSGAYTLTVTDSNGCTDLSGPHAVTDLGGPVINTSAVVIDSSRCDQPTGAISGITVSGGVGPYTYLWNDPSFQSNLNATGLDCNPYVLIVTDAAGCNLPSAQIVPCFSAPAAPTAASPAPYCSGDPIADLTATGTTGVINWYSDAPLLDSIGTGSPFTSGATSDISYWVAETRNGCIGGATQVDITITPTPAAPFAGNDMSICFGAIVLDTLNIIGGTGTQWWDDPGLTILLGTGDSLPIAPVLGTNIYYVTQFNGSCQGPYDSVIVTLDVPITVTITGNTVICAGDTTVLTASGGSTYLWSTTETTASIIVSPAATAVYSVFATGGACSATATDTVTVNSQPVASITPSGLSFCAGETVTLTAGLAQTYSWDTSPISTTQIITVTPPAGNSTTYTLTVTNGCGTDVTSQNVVVESAISAGPDIDLCKNTDLAGYGATSSATPVGGTWSSPDPLVFPGNLQTDGFVDHIAIPWGPGYELVYTSLSGNCADTLLLEVTGAEAGSDTAVCTGTGSFFLANASPPGGTWSAMNLSVNMDGLSGEVFTDGLAGEYTFVYATMGITKDCPDTVVVSVCGSNDIWVPNIFSPNGDDANDIMFVRGIAVDWVHIRIYDRWGELVYDSGQGQKALKGLGEGWDGTYKGKELTPQVFVYYLDAAFIDGELVETMKGNITLVK
ncbi:MAG: gliding motility-associated C-terminal domain-containing protein, partial [Flavobacteriales bacterium]|nr:gliding motility-associated C-terminal domain-containing protein [Flavobacteriales bacterium]